MADLLTVVRRRGVCGAVDGPGRDVMVDDGGRVGVHGHVGVHGRALRPGAVVGIELVLLLRGQIAVVVDARGALDLGLVVATWISRPCRVAPSSVTKDWLGPKRPVLAVTQLGSPVWSSR